MKRKLNQLFLSAALMCGAISMTSCQGLIDAVFGDFGNSSGSTTKPTTTESAEELAEKQLIAEAVALIEEAQEEGSVTTLSMTLDGVEYPFTFKMENGQFVLQKAAGTRGDTGDDPFDKYAFAVKTLSFSDAEKKQFEEEYNFDSDPEYDPDLLFWDNNILDFGAEYVGDRWNEDEDIEFENMNEIAKVGIANKDEYETREWNENKEKHANRDWDTLILDITVKNQNTDGNTVLEAQYDPTTLSMTQTGENGNSCSSTVTVNNTTMDVTTKTPTCSITYPNGKEKSLYFMSGRFKNWEELIMDFPFFTKKKDYIVFENYWVCESDGKTLVTSDSEVKSSYKFCHKVSKIDFDFEGKDNKDVLDGVSAGDKFRVKIVPYPADAVISGVFMVSELKPADVVSTEKVPGEDNVFEVTALKDGKFQITFEYVDYGKSFKKYLRGEIQSGTQTDPTPSIPSDAITMESSTKSWGKENDIVTYVVSKDVTIDGEVELINNVELILMDGVTLTINGSITGNDSSVLTIYGQANNSGKLNVTYTDDTDSAEGLTVGELYVHGGKISVTGMDNGIYINDGCIFVYGGKVTATGTAGYGISGNNSTISISDIGEVNAVGGKGDIDKDNITSL